MAKDCKPSGDDSLMVEVNPKLLHAKKHRLDKMVGARLADGLRQQYGRRSARVVEGDSVRVMRGEYKGVEGKVERIHVKFGTLVIEGIQHEKVKGGQVKVPIHASKVMITSAKADDKLRFGVKIQEPAQVVSTQAQAQTESAPKPSKTKRKTKVQRARKKKTKKTKTSKKGASK